MIIVAVNSVVFSIPQFIMVRYAFSVTHIILPVKASCY